MYTKEHLDYCSFIISFIINLIVINNINYMVISLLFRLFTQSIFNLFYTLIEKANVDSSLIMIND
jgi:hypothetical protein